MLVRCSLSRHASRAAGAPLPFIGRLHANPNYALERTGAKFPQPSFASLSFNRNLSTEHSFPPTHSSEIASTSPIGSEIFESSSQELWAADAARTLAEGETLTSLGLGGYSPSGFVQYILDTVHTTTGLPWWLSIVATTLCIKVALIPFSLYAREQALKMRPINPQVEILKARQKEFVLARDIDRANEEKAKMLELYKKHGVNPLKAMLPTLAQAVIMISFFFAIRKMAYAPIPSMMTEGTLWFTDLTLNDPTFLLPIISSALLMVSFEVGFCKC